MAMSFKHLSTMLFLRLSLADDFLAKKVDTADMAEDITNIAGATARGLYPTAMADCCCECPYGYDRHCSPQSGQCYTDRVDTIKDYYELCYGPIAPNACPGGTQTFEWWYGKYTEYEFMDCVHDAAQTSQEDTGSAQECAVFCDTTSWCEGFSIDFNAGTCWLLGEFSVSDSKCVGPSSDEFSTWSINTWKRHQGTA